MCATLAIVRTKWNKTKYDHELLKVLKMQHHSLNLMRKLKREGCEYRLCKTYMQYIYFLFDIYKIINFFSILFYFNIPLYIYPLHFLYMFYGYFLFCFYRKPLLMMVLNSWRQINYLFIHLLKQHKNLYLCLLNV